MLPANLSVGSVSVAIAREKKFTTKNARHTVWPSIQLWPTDQWSKTESIKTPRVRGVCLKWPRSDLSHMTEGKHRRKEWSGVVVRRVEGWAGFLYRQRRSGDQSCLARKEPIPRRTAPAAQSLRPASTARPGWDKWTLCYSHCSPLIHHRQWRPLLRQSIEGWSQRSPLIKGPGDVAAKDFNCPLSAHYTGRALATQWDRPPGSYCQFGADTEKQLMVSAGCQRDTL